VEKMKYYTFRSEKNNFADILNDLQIKPHIKFKLSWREHLILGFPDNKKYHNLFGYIVLKYGELLSNPIAKDFTPVMYVEYLPKRNGVIMGPPTP
jgi:hypothetical protein